MMNLVPVQDILLRPPVQYQTIVQEIQDIIVVLAVVPDVLFQIQIAGEQYIGLVVHQIIVNRTIGVVQAGHASHHGLI